MSVKVFDQDAREAFSAAIRDGATTLGNSLKEALHTLNNDSLHQSSVDAAKQLGDSIGNGMIELADKFYWPIVLLLLSITVFFIAAAVYCCAKAMRHKQTLAATSKHSFILIAFQKRESE